MGPLQQGGGTVDASTKHRLRATTRAARDALSTEERAQASARIVERLLALPEMRSAGTVLMYASVPGEVDVGGMVPALHAAGARTLFPRVRGSALELVAASDLRTLQLGYRGVREPSGPAIDPAVVDVAVVPGLAFDPRGGRLGSGGGHYDRLLVRLPQVVVRIGVGFNCQVVPLVPREIHDEPVQLVVTETAVHHAAGGRRS